MQKTQKAKSQAPADSLRVRPPGGLKCACRKNSAALLRTIPPALSPRPESQPHPPLVLSHLPPHHEGDKNDKIYHFLEGALRVTARFSSIWHRTILTNDTGSMTSVAETTQALNPSCHSHLFLFSSGSILCIYSVYIMGSSYLSLCHTRL